MCAITLLQKSSRGARGWKHCENSGHGGTLCHPPPVPWRPTWQRPMSWRRLSSRPSSSGTGSRPDALDPFTRCASSSTWLHRLTPPSCLNRPETAARALSARILAMARTVASSMRAPCARRGPRPHARPRPGAQAPPWPRCAVGYPLSLSEPLQCATIW